MLLADVDDMKSTLISRRRSPNAAAIWGSRCVDRGCSSDVTSRLQWLQLGTKPPATPVQLYT